jgi:acetaldehyde dehydrogenase (acetylating)
MSEAAQNSGAPAGSIGWMKTVTLEGTQELMKHRDIAVILATGGMGLVRAAYSAGKPAYGVGPGNAPCYIESSADLEKAAGDIVLGKTFDYGVLCSSPNSVVVDESVAEETRRKFEARGAYFLNQSEMDALAKVLVSPQRLPNPALVGKSATFIAGKAGIAAPSGTTVLIAPLSGVGRDYPLSIEKLCPVLSWYVVKDWREGCERCIQILRYGGMGHTMSIHSKNDDVILQFGLKKPAFRICVNTPTTHGSIGLTTGLDPAMTLGCGGWGGNITSDNISPRHLLNIKRLAYEVRPAVQSGSTTSRDERAHRDQPVVAQRLPKPSASPLSPGISAQTLSARVDAFLSSRGFRPGDDPQSRRADAKSTALSADNPREFICEDDVREALKSGKRLLVGDRTIVTPSARELGDANKVFVDTGWPR